MEIVNKLRFKDIRDVAFSDSMVKNFCLEYIDPNIYGLVEVYPTCIYLFKHGESGFSHYNMIISPKNSKEMLCYLSAKVESKNNNRNFHLLKIKYITPTNTRGSRVKIIDLRFNKSKTIPFNYEFDCIVEMVKSEIKNKSLIQGKAWDEKTKDYYLILNSDNNGSFVELGGIK
jgi:hypothetical protein